MVSKVVFLFVFLIFVATNKIYCATCNKETEMDDSEIDNCGKNQIQIKRLRGLSRLLSNHNTNKFEFEGKRFQPQIRLGRRFNEK